VASLIFTSLLIPEHLPNMYVHLLFLDRQPEH
jgi:hypothetical protein